MRLAVALVLLLAAGCLTPGAPPAQETPVATRTLEQGATSGVHEPVRNVLPDEAAWAAFWDRHASAQIPPPERPAVDFAAERVVVVGLGDKNDGCWGVEVSGVVRSGSEVVVNVTTLDRHGAGACTQAITQPHHIVAIRDTSAAVRFEEAVRGRN